MNLPDAPIADEGFFATHFFTVRDQEKSKDCSICESGFLHKYGGVLESAR
jgi:hypothetical protein